ncbi:aldose epimerase family protein [Lutibacter citreus]|uniref:aldose epimerase family protein n=1 Tax=Lutibacter citreus TaxID=2138210 RepID=UPI001FE2FC3D|nr:aldose 1-epimerase [Lutibacter citreus]
MILISSDKNSIVEIDKGELLSYIFNKEELIHQKGTAGWRNSDTEMFPIIGPTKANKFNVVTPKGNYNQDQHGLLRELNYKIEKQTENTCIFQKKYTAYTAVENSKYPEKSVVRLVSWPYNFTFKKIFNLNNNSLNITFEVISEKGMPFMLGYHPAFKLNGNNSEICNTAKESITLQEIIDSGASAYPILNTNEITLIKEKGYNINIKTSGYNNFMLWTEVPNMLCIEPITAYPYVEGKLLSKELFNNSKGLDTFEVLISPLK